MVLIEETSVGAGDLPVVQMKDHLRLGSGFADDGLQNGLVESYLRAAVATIEGRIGKALIARRFRWEVPCWRGAQAQALPVAPVGRLVSVTMVDVDGVRREVTGLRLERDTHRPRLVTGQMMLPDIPTGGYAEVVFEAGFGTWAAVPADLAQAVMLLAGEYYENRHEAGLRAAGLPAVVSALIERWRIVRVLGGGAA